MIQPIEGADNPPDGAETQRLRQIYENLRLRLLDLTKRNQLLNYGLSSRSKRFLQAIDCNLEFVHRRLAGEEGTLRITPLPEPDEVPAEERTEEFRAALNRARATDAEYQNAIEAMEVAGQVNEAELEKFERLLKNRLREQLGLPPKPALKEINKVEHARSLGIEPSLSLSSSSVKCSDELQTLKFPDELKAALEKISGDAYLAEQEMGLSTLYLAFGFLEWYESESSEKKAFAPLILLPVQIEKQSIRGKPVFSIGLREGGAEANLSLQKLLEQNFSRQLPDFQSSDDEVINSVEAYFEKVTTAVEGLKRWQVRRWLVLGNFSFGRHAMYADLDTQKWGELANRKLLSSLLRGSDQRDDGAPLPGIPEDYSIDQPEVEELAPFLIQDADASQHSALIDVMRGDNLVIQGPPGTGKSQTITNVIANAIACGKTVLFLAEKQAALEVVKRRLDRSGLGEFCLELHSGKVSPKAVIASVKERYELGTGVDVASAASRRDPIWRQAREEISSYLRALHRPELDGTTAFDLIWKAVYQASENLDIADYFTDVSLDVDLLRDGGQIELLGSDLVAWAAIAQDFADIFGHPASSRWAAVVLGEIPSYEAPRLLRVLTSWRDLSRAAQQIILPLMYLGIGDEQDLNELVALDESLGAVPQLGPMTAILDLDLDDLEAALITKAELISIEAELSTIGGLRHRALDHLAPALSLLHTNVGDSLSNIHPSAAFEQVADEISRLQETIEAAQGAMAVLGVLGMSDSAIASHLRTAATAGVILATSPVRCWAWLSGLASLDDVSFAETKRRWQDLLIAENSWRQKLTGYHPDMRPSLNELRGFAGILRKSGFAKLVASVTGAFRNASEYCVRLGIDASADALDSLAAHLVLVHAFESDTLLASKFGSAWNGLKTPFEELEEAIQVRTSLCENVRSLPGGSLIVDRALVLDISGIESLSRSVVVLMRLRDLDPDSRTSLDERPLDSCLISLESRNRDLRHFLSLDPERSIATIDAPLHLIARTYQLLLRRNRTLISFETHPSARRATDLGTNTINIESTRAAIDWIRIVRASDTTEQIKAALMNEGVLETREIIRRISRQWVLIEAQRNEKAKALTDFGMSWLVTMPSKESLPIVDGLLESGGELSSFLILRQSRIRLDSAGLNQFLQACDLNLVEPRRVPAAFSALVAKRRAAQVRQVQELAFQNGTVLEARRRAFAERDIAKIKSDRGFIRSKLLQAVPPIGSQYGPRKTWTDMRLLANEFPKVKRFTPLRQVLARAGSALQTLKPCFMMSPLSLAKFSTPGLIEFDLLVIDEASQMRPEDALGGMLRAKQVVVVGDAKQLPPTDFFSRAGGDQLGTADDDDDIDAESILDACETSFGKRRRLRWHYRSRCESLIAFSNNAFYDDGLITFPMAKPGSFSVQLVRVDGIYRNRRNPAEAAKVAEETITFMRHFAETPEDDLPTLGVVAINTEQREFIEEELSRLWADDRLVEAYLTKARSKGEPFFVKNLENVQGDERDHIFISMTYGRKHGELIVGQQFGPINRKQGHRRLNVLFTRARVRMGLFTSFGSADVRPNEGSSEGVRALKRFLEYSETQGRALVRGIGGEADSDFEVAVASRLRLKGYEVDLQVGVSSFRIDLGVRHPDHPEHFLAGVECDGAAYHSSKSARDRDRLREDVLRSLGWNIVRVWSTDWFDNPELETEKLARRLEELRARSPFQPKTYPLLHEPEDDSCDSDSVINPVRTEGGAPEVTTETGQSELGHFQTFTPSDQFVRVGSDLDSLAIHEPLTPQAAFVVLESFRETEIKAAIADWVPQRSILRPVMIETFVSKRISDPDDWFSRIPQYLRIGTDPEEKRLFLDKICEIVDRISDAGPALTKPIREKQDGGTEIEQEHRPPPGTNLSLYTHADPASVGHPDRDRFYDETYTSTLAEMIEHVIAVEGPIFEDALIDRIARAHGLMRSGNQIRRRVVSLLQPNILREEEGGRKVIWPASKNPGQVHPYRRDPTGKRTHEDVPAEEIASIAFPFLRLRMNDEVVLRRITEEFSLGRLREAARSRFEIAIEIAKRSLIR